MRGENNRVGLRMAIDELSPGFARAVLVVTKTAVPLGMRALHRVVHQVAGKDRVFAAGRQIEANMARGMPWRGLDPKGVVYRVIAVDEQRLAGVDDRRHAIAKTAFIGARAPAPLVLVLRPIGVFGSVE